MRSPTVYPGLSLSHAAPTGSHMLPMIALKVVQGFVVNTVLIPLPRPLQFLLKLSKDHEPVTTHSPMS